MYCEIAYFGDKQLKHAVNILLIRSVLTFLQLAAYVNYQHFLIILTENAMTVRYDGTSSFTHSICFPLHLFAYTLYTPTFPPPQAEKLFCGVSRFFSTFTFMFF